MNKFMNKAKKDPLVPVGCAATLSCLVAGLYTFFKGHANLSQKMMRARVVAQAATVVVLVAGSFVTIKGEEPRPKGMSPIEHQLLQQEKMQPR